MYAQTERVNMSSEFSLKFYGCRGSFPVAGPQYATYGGRTSCMVVRTPHRQLVFDAGTGIVAHGHDLLKTYAQDQAPITTNLFMTHWHQDHFIGLPFFSPMYMQDSTIRVWAPLMGGMPSVQKTLETVITPPFFPVPLHEMGALKSYHTMAEYFAVYFFKDDRPPLRVRANHPSEKHLIPPDDEIDAQVHCMRGYNHPKSGVLLYKIICGGKTIIYATDTEGYVHGDQRLEKFAQGADILIHDAMYTSDQYISMPTPTQGFGHSTVKIATTVAHSANVKRLYLFHHDPTSTDTDLDRVQSIAQGLFKESFCAQDDLVVDLV